MHILIGYKEYFNQVIWDMWISLRSHPELSFVLCVWIALTDENCGHLAVCYWAAGRLPSVHCVVQHMMAEWLQSFPDHRAAAFIPSFWSYRVREIHSGAIGTGSNKKKAPPTSCTYPLYKLFGWLVSFIVVLWKPGDVLFVIVWML